MEGFLEDGGRGLQLLLLYVLVLVLEKLLEVGLCLYGRWEGVSPAEDAEVVEGEGHGGRPEGDEGALKIHEQ